MILTLNDLPSKGLYSPGAQPINLKPLKFLEIMDYSNEVTGTEIKKYLRDISYLQRMDPGILHHSLYDLDYIIFMMKVHTISDTKEFNTDIECSHCGSKNRISIALEDFQFIDVEPKDKLIKKVLLGGYGYKVRIPTIGEFLKVLKTYNLYNKTERADIPKLISLFPEFETMPNDIEQAVFGANKKDITILYLLESNYLSSVKPIKRTCSSCNINGGMAIGISSLIADMFRDVLLNNPVDESEVQFE